MFFFTYLRRELRRRMGRTVLTVLGLGVGVAMVVAITAVSNGLDDAQQQVLNPLASVGTDLLVTRPVQDSGTSADQQQQASPPSTDPTQGDQGGCRRGPPAASVSAAVADPAARTAACPPRTNRPSYKRTRRC